MAHFSVKRMVEFHHTDMAGIVHFSEYFRYMAAAEHAMFRSLDLSVMDHKRNLGWPRVSVGFDYMKPLFFEDEFDVTITIDKLGTSSLTITAEIVKDGEILARGTSTSVCCAHDENGVFGKTAIPEFMRTKLTALMESA